MDLTYDGVAWPDRKLCFFSPERRTPVVSLFFFCVGTRSVILSPQPKSINPTHPVRLIPLMMPNPLEVSISDLIWVPTRGTLQRCSPQQLLHAAVACGGKLLRWRRCFFAPNHAIAAIAARHCYLGLSPSIGVCFGGPNPGAKNHAWRHQGGPDVWFFNPLNISDLRRAVAETGPAVWTPKFHLYNGLNDRFAFGNREGMKEGFFGRTTVAALCEAAHSCENLSMCAQWDPARLPTDQPCLPTTPWLRVARQDPSHVVVGTHLVGKGRGEASRFYHRHHQLEVPNFRWSHWTGV